MTYGPTLTKNYTTSEKGLNQYESLTQYDSEFTEGLLFTYTYDDNGNLTDIDSSEDSYDYVYDCENRLIEAKKNGQTVGTYTYDFAGRRVTKTADGITTKYYYDGDHVIAEYEGGSLARKYVYGPGIDEPIRMITSGDSYYYHHNRQGSIVALSDSSGDIVENYQYDAFGKFLVHTVPGPDGLWMTADDVIDSVSAQGNPYTFTGRRYDPETGLYYYRARMYDPGDGRFLQTDPIGYIGGLNLYTYCGNNPLYWVDPYGLSYTWPWNWKSGWTYVFIVPHGLYEFTAHYWGEPWAGITAYDPMFGDIPKQVGLQPVGQVAPPGLSEAVGAAEAMVKVGKLSMAVSKRNKRLNDLHKDDPLWKPLPTLPPDKDKSCK